MNNPLLTPHQLPPFSAIKPAHIQPALELILKDNRAQLLKLLGANEFTWESFIVPLEAMEDRLNQMWSPVGHLNAVMNSSELREAYQACLPLLSQYSTELGHNQPLFDAYQFIKTQQYDQLDSAQQKVIDNALRDFKLSGIDLHDEAKKQFAKLSQRHTELCNQFSENVLDSTQAWQHLVSDVSELDGIPEHAIEGMRAAATQHEKKGFLLTLDFPCYVAVVTHCDNRKLREKMYHAFATRASDQADIKKFNNDDIITELLAIRLELAKLIGFKNFAEESLISKMAESTDHVMGFLNDLADRGAPKAKEEVGKLKAFAKTQGDIDDFQTWDVAYYAEKLRKHLFSFNEEELRPYFPLEKVLAGMFAVTHKLYDVTVKPVDSIDVWHEDVRCFAIYNKDGKEQGMLYMDLYARQHKRDGAWMDECRQRRMLPDGGIQHPVAYLTCNFRAPLADKPSLLAHQEVVTLFHEFGHCLHHLLTQVDHYDVAGINGVEWDAVELPSQFFENFAWADETLPMIAEHYETGEPLPEKLKTQMQNSKTFNAGMQLVRQVTFALFDFQLHLQAPAIDAEQAQALLNNIRNTLSPFTTPAYNRFQNSFSHIFAGGYAAGYYSYLWAEILAADVFAKFKENDVLSEKVGREFLDNILSKGGSAKAMELFVNFRGREPSPEALLESYDC
jgi:oligopeptidase A